MSRLTGNKVGGGEDQESFIPEWRKEEEVYQEDVTRVEKVKHCVVWRKKKNILWFPFLDWKLCFKITLKGRHMVWLDRRTQRMPTGFLFLSLISTLSWLTLTPGGLCPHDQQQMLLFLWSDFQTPCKRERTFVLGLREVLFLIGSGAYHWTNQYGPG